jgi:isopenicillin N synthase-like dioxygenase
VKASAQIPVLLLAEHACGGEARAVFSRDLFAGLQRFGFVIIREHTVLPALLERAYALCAQLFALPEEAKGRYRAGPRGYAPFGTEHAKDRATADMKEFWQIGPEGGTPPNLWPTAPPGFQSTFLELFQAFQASGVILLSALTPGLGVPEDFFATRLVGCNSVLRLLHYPPVPADADPEGTRSAAHEDINLLTLLPAPRGPGLEIRDRDGAWLTIEALPHDLIVDSGDMMARLTNGVIPATTHRVLRPPDAGQSRYSMPFFMHPDPEVVLACLPSCAGHGVPQPDITAGEFLEQRLRAIGLIRG